MSSCSSRPIRRTVLSLSLSSSMSLRLSALTTSFSMMSSPGEMCCNIVDCSTAEGAAAAAAEGTVHATGGATSHLAIGGSSWSTGTPGSSASVWFRSAHENPACFTANSSSAAACGLLLTCWAAAMRGRSEVSQNNNQRRVVASPTLPDLAEKREANERTWPSVTTYSSTGHLDPRCEIQSRVTDILRNTAATICIFNNNK
eukprot:scaffold309092_cov32-Tisochrysis_lutea.AAC.1